MAGTLRARIGFISPRSSGSPHLSGFRALVPQDVQLDLVGLELARGSLWDLKGTKQHVVARAAELARQHQWQGMVLSGAPLELLNPGILQEVRAAVDIPVATAMVACVAALKAFSARRVLLMTPFDESMNQLLKEHLATSGIEAVSPPSAFDVYTDATRLGPEEVYDLTRRGLQDAGEVQAIYFQGAILDPLKIIKRMEEELRAPVVASNPAMLWFILSTLGLSYQISGAGKLLEQWCKLSE